MFKLNAEPDPCPAEQQEEAFRKKLDPVADAEVIETEGTPPAEGETPKP